MSSVRVSAPAFHGFAPPVLERESFLPPLCVAISRETGSRGRAIAGRTAELLGCQLILQENIEYLARHADEYASMVAGLSESAQVWVENRVKRLLSPELGSPIDAQLAPLARSILQVAAQDNCVILGRGAGVILPSESCLHVRLVAPEQDRIAYISQSDRLSVPDAENFVREREEARKDFLRRLGKAPTDVSSYDLIINVVNFGIEASAAIIATAAKEKQGFQDQRRVGPDEV